MIFIDYYPSSHLSLSLSLSSLKNLPLVIESKIFGNRMNLGWTSKFIGRPNKYPDYQCGRHYVCMDVFILTLFRLKVTRKIPAISITLMMPDSVEKGAGVGHRTA